jgi:hypothetical protein
VAQQVKAAHLGRRISRPRTFHHRCGGGGM